MKSALEVEKSLTRLFFYHGLRRRGPPTWKGAGEMARKYKRLRYADRQTIEQMLKAGDSVIVIAGVLGVHRDTIYKELARNGADQHTYKADAAQAAL